MQSAERESTEYQSTDLSDNFWQIASSFYEKKPHQISLLELQDDFCLNVNRILFVLWYSSKFHQLIDLSLISAEPQNFSEVEKSIGNIRNVRRDFESNWKKPIIGHYNMARYHLLEGELALEKESQVLLVNYYCRADLVQHSNQETGIDDITLDFLITENFERFCFGPAISELISQELRNQLQDLSLTWIDF